jgi:teichuronic acid biosynthesis glycosyltransferase TuaG
MQEGLCSVIVPAYNCARTLAESVASAVGQTYANLEILIIDDASTDETWKVMQDLVALDDRIKITHLEKNGGVADARNHLFLQASGSYIAFLDSDDIWHADKLEKQIGLLESSGCDLVYSSYSFIDGEGRAIGRTKIVPSACSLKAILKENFILPSTVVMRSNWVKNHTMDGSYAHEDLVFWLGLFQDGLTAVGNPEVLIQYRIYENNRSGNKAKAAKNRWLVYRRYLGYSLVKSLWYFAHYTLNGLRKYQGIQKQQ